MRVIVPQPPALDLLPTRPRALVTVVVGEQFREVFRLTGPYMREYADRVDADLVVLDWPGVPDWPLSAKFAVARTLDTYDRIAYVDADVLLRPTAVDLFDQCGPEEFGAYDELPDKPPADGADHLSKLALVRSDLGRHPVADHRYVNSGVFVCPQRYGPLLLPPAVPLTVHHGAEECFTNVQLADHGAEVRPLDRRANWMWWYDRFAQAPPDAVLHWVCARDKAESIRRFLR